MTPTPTVAAPLLTHPCARCGAPVAIEVGLCERCNPLGLRDSASSQVHGTVFVAVGLAIVGLMLLAHWAVAGIGPFRAEIVGMRPVDGQLEIAVKVTNDGSNPGTTTCRVSDPVSRGAGQSTFFLTPRIGAKESRELVQRVTGLGDEVRPLAIECSAP